MKRILLIGILGTIVATTSCNNQEPKSTEKQEHITGNLLSPYAVSKKTDEIQYHANRLIEEPGLYQSLLNFERSVCAI